MIEDEVIDKIVEKFNKTKSQAKKLYVEKKSIIELNLVKIIDM